MLASKLEQLQQQYRIQVIDLAAWFDQPVYARALWLKKQLLAVYRPEYTLQERVVFTLTRSDLYTNITDPCGQLIQDLHRQLNQVDISNYFVIVLTNDAVNIAQACEWAQTHVSLDPVAVTVLAYDHNPQPKQTTEPMTQYNYNSAEPTRIRLADLKQQHQDLLTQNPSFCMYPWIHLHAYPTGQAYPCCQAEMHSPVGNTQTDTLEHIWNDQPMRDIRQRMLQGDAVAACTRCYEQEASGFFSGRQSANKHHGHNIARVDRTLEDGTVPDFGMTYWDIRFSNLCNLSCRSCGHIFSSSWYADQAALAGPEWAQKHTVLNYAGRSPTDIWEQLLPHIDSVEQIYFAGGEPLMMEEHYNILDELERRGRFDVRLIYNTNFTHTRLKDRTVFDYWKKFTSVSVGASLDAQGARAEYIRKGTRWDRVVRNRELMLETCPEVDFYISPTLSIMNALHLPDFHLDWVARGLIRPPDLNINILQDPPHLRVDMATAAYKQQIRERYQAHIEWLRPQDTLQRARQGFESAVTYMDSTDNSALLPVFWSKMAELDRIRGEDLLTVIPELGALR